MGSGSELNCRKASSNDLLYFSLYILCNHLMTTFTNFTHTHTHTHTHTIVSTSTSIFDDDENVWYMEIIANEHADNASNQS